MKKTEHNSLAYYLERGLGPFHLEVTYEDNSGIEGHPFSFLVLSDADPLSRTIKGRIVTDAGATVKEVLLLVQRDEYPIADDPLCSIANPDVERAWQEAFSSYLREGKGDSLFLSGQIDQSGNLVPMAPLFFCNRTNSFFPPFCPACSLPLEQCEDDELLALAGLRPYSGSLRRYLHCPACSGRGKLRFYAYKTDSLDPPDVEDRFGLIRRLGFLVFSSHETEGFPCRACQFRDECYGIEQKAGLSVIPFAFYPFHMLIVSSFSLNVWNREQREEKEDRLAAREQGLRLGWSLITAVAAAQNDRLAKTGIPERLELLRDGVREEVSTEGLGPVQQDSAPREEEVGDVPLEEALTNDDIRALLSEIARDWRNRAAGPIPKPADTQLEDDSEESVETVFLTIADLEESSITFVPKEGNEVRETATTPPAGRGLSDDMEKTVILSPSLAEKEIDLEKTVILGANQTAPATTPQAVPGAPFENEIHPGGQQADVEETVIISPGYRTTGSRTGAGETGVRQEAGVQEEGEPKPKAPKSDMDDLEATVILKVDDRPKTRGGR